MLVHINIILKYGKVLYIMTVLQEIHIDFLIWICVIYLLYWKSQIFYLSSHVNLKQSLKSSEA